MKDITLIITSYLGISYDVTIFIIILREDKIFKIKSTKYLLSIVHVLYKLKNSSQIMYSYFL